MTMSKIMIILLTSIFIVSLSCSTTNNQDANLDQKIIVNDIQVWLNLMPGGPGSFHISGKFDYNDLTETKIKLKNIYIYCFEKLIYDIEPELFLEKKNTSFNPRTKTFQFYNQSGLRIDDVLMSTEKLDVNFVFDIDGLLVNKFAKDVQLTRAY